MPRFDRFLRALVFIGFVLFGRTAHASDKNVIIESTPSGAEVDVNGSITCTTPCTLHVSGGYFGAKHTAFSSHVDQPLSIRLLKEGYLPKDMLLTLGPLVWKSFNGQNTFEYYLVTSDHFDIRLTPISEFVGQGVPRADPIEDQMKMASTIIPSEEIVRKALPAIVQVQTAQKSGSGFFISAEGLVATNAHVVDGQSTATIITSTGKAFQSSNIYTDQDRDLALIKVDIHDVEFLTLSQTLPMQGSDVIAIGTPGAHDATGVLLLPNTVTKGIVSGLRQFSDSTVANIPGRAGTWIQTDAMINHGNSGGPLLSRSGEVVGVNTLSFTATGTPGINFALASPELLQVVHLRLGLTLPSPATSEPTSAKVLSAKIAISSVPAGADIEVDGVFLGNTPSDVSVTEGPRIIRLSKKGFKPYQRTIQAQANGSQRIAAELDPETESPAPVPTKP